MTKAMFGIAAALSILTTSAGADDERRTSKPAGHVVATHERSPMASDARNELEEGQRVAAAAEASIREGEPAAVRNFDPRAWLVEREGYRDGGH